MIKVLNLSKNYISKNHNDHLALDDVSFTLPSRGMVFILGKSGSGKSTLLNILGGLDNPTGGKIIVDGNDFDDFKDKDFDNYRNTYLGFIFQDFHLIENMNVKQNILLSLDLQGKKNKGNLKEVLKQVELEGFEKRYPSELSGGQQQRVAIARAIIKKPRLILADEPTGNLDSKTSKHVLDVLKELAKNTLVVVVSHNKDDANNYADRIIELSDGKIIRDVSRKNKYQNKLIEDKVINFPHNVRLTNEELKQINEKVKEGGYTISQKNDAFSDTIRFFEKGKYVKIKPRHIKPNKIINLSRKYNKGNYFSSLFTSLMIAFIVIIISICQIFSSFDSKKMINDFVTSNDETSFVLQKGFYEGVIYPKLKDDKVIRIEDSEIQEFYDNGYEGNIYKLYNKTLPFAPKLCESNADLLGTVNYSSMQDMYVTYGRGVLDCDIEFLAKKYGQNGNINLLAGSLDEEFNVGGVIITDYLADAIIYHNPSLLLLTKEAAYNYIVNLTSGINDRFLVKGIVETNYLERYQQLVDLFKLKFNLDTLNKFNEEFNKMKDSQIFHEFVNELNEFLTIGYYVDQKDIETAMFENARVTFIHVNLAHTNYFVDGKLIDSLTNSGNWAIAGGQSIDDGEIVIGYEVYNQIFGTNITPSDNSEFEVREFTISRYDVVDIDRENPIISKTFKVVNVLSDYGTGLIVNDNELRELASTSFVPYALYFDNVESITSIFDGSNNSKNAFFSTNEYYKTMYKIQDIVKIFNDLFAIIVIGLGLVCFALLVSYIKRTIDSKKYEIGILRAIGGKNFHLFWIFIYQIGIIVLSTFLLSFLGLGLIDGFVNQILIDNLSKFLIPEFVQGLEIISFNPYLLLFINGIVAFISLGCSFSILSSLRNIEPINIIKSKEL